LPRYFAKRLKLILAFIISPEQSAFVPGRLITDNILVAFETLYTMGSRLKGKEGFMPLKLDMSKSYNRVEWAFLEVVMHKLGFNEQWIQILMSCVRTISYSILINGQPYGNITPSQGIRQGDPLSPYFFIICVEAMSSLTHKEAREGRITGVPVFRGCTSIHHLFFPDDSLLFC
jgi:hypothetical protein